MTDYAATMARDLRELSEPCTRGEKIGDIITRVARAAGLDYWRTYDLYYKRTRRIEPSEIECVAAALVSKRREAARNEFQELRIRLARLESIMAQTDPDFVRTPLDAISDQSQQMGRTGGPTARSVRRPTIGGKLR